MYQIYADSVCIFDDTIPDQRSMVVSPRLQLTAGAAGSLSFTVPKGAYGYDTIQRLTTTISVLRDGETIWMGRVLSEQRDVWDNRQLFCEGALSFLNDTVPMIANPTLGGVLTAHNAMVAANRQLVLGSCAYGSVEMEPDGSTSLSIVNQKLVGALGGVLRMRYPLGVPTLDWLENYPVVTGDEQELVFGENLLDFTRNWDLTDFATCCYVQGAEIEDSNGGTGFHYNSGWVESTAAATYGKIYKFLSYSDLDSVALCQQEAAAYLATQQFAEMTLQVTALDLHILNPAVKSFDLLERVHVKSWQHGLDSWFAVTGLDIPLDAPENTVYTLGYVNTAYVRRVRTLTKQQLQQDEQLREDIEETGAQAKKHADEIAMELNQTIEDARQEIYDTMSSLTEGYVFIDTNGTNTQGIYITDSPITSVSEITPGMHVWKWSMTGLGYSDDGGTTWRTAMTYDGKINADLILTGLLMVQYIKLYGNMAVYDSSSGSVPGGYLGYGAGANSNGDTTPGIHMFVDNGATEVIVTSAGARMSFGNYHLYISSNGVEITGGGGLPCDLTVNGDINYTGSLNPI